MALYLITGACGFIGSHFANGFSGDCVLLDALKTGGDISNIVSDDRKKFIFCDITDKEMVESIFEKYHFDVIINFAAETHVDRSFYQEELFYKTNVEGVRILLDACVKYGVKRFIQISTDEVYGPSDGYLFKETDVLNPTNPYSRSKALADELVLEYYKKYGLHVNITRSANNYGTNQYEEKLIPFMIKKAMNNEKLPIYGDGEQLRDWISVEDNCKAIQLVLEKGLPGEIYNISAHCEKTNNDIVKRILKILSKSESLIEHIEDRKNHDQRYQMDTKKIESLGWKPQTDFDKEFEKVVFWYKHKFSKL